MPSSAPTSKIFQLLAMLALGLTAVLTHLPAAARAESYPSDRAAEPAKSATGGKIKAKSKETWDDMKARWARQKERWAECQKQEKAEKRSRTATREFLEDCMKQ